MHHQCEEQDLQGPDIPIMAIAALLASAKKTKARKKGSCRNSRTREGLQKRKRSRRSVEDIYNELGPGYFRRAYRMKYESFTKLVDILAPFFPPKDSSMALVNGMISDSIRLAMSLRYFAGGSPYDIATTFGVAVSEVYVSVWRTIDAANCCPQFAIEYPASYNEQQSIAKGFEEVSGVDFKMCAGAIDGILIWIHKPSAACCKEAKCSDGKFLCGRKNKFGLNLQAVAGVDGCFLDISIMYPASTSDCLAWFIFCPHANGP